MAKSTRSPLLPQSLFRSFLGEAGIAQGPTYLPSPILLCGCLPITELEGDMRSSQKGEEASVRGVLPPCPAHYLLRP